MTRAYNFNPGPSMLPLEVLKETAAELADYQGKGMSMVEMSHRSKEYDKVHMDAMKAAADLLGLGEKFKVLLLGGGATLQFAMAPMNLLAGGRSCDFTVTGSWAKKALADAKKAGAVNVLFDGKEGNYSSLPDPADLKVDAGAAYLHMTSNETIGGIQWQAWPETGDVPIVCDMSSDIMSRRIPVEKFGVIYAGAQKNLGPAGVTMVIIRSDVLERCSDDLPAYLSYKTHAKDSSLYNTPPVFGVYMMGKVLDWVGRRGGLEAMEKLANERSGLVYDVIEGSGGYYRSPVARGCRSRMNVVWRLPTEDLEKSFIAEAAGRGMLGLKGHRSVGGCRASMYNAMPVEGAKALAEFMKDFAKKNG
jgi:phosphoserine aminotransferase